MSPPPRYMPDIAMALHRKSKRDRLLEATVLTKLIVGKQSIVLVASSNPNDAIDLALVEVAHRFCQYSCI